MSDTCLRRRILVTKDGSLGLRPQVMEPGDAVANLFGFSNPVVLRPLQATDHYLVCGEAYVHGLIDGTWTDAQFAEGRKDEEFYLH